MGRILSIWQNSVLKCPTGLVSFDTPARNLRVKFTENPVCALGLKSTLLAKKWRSQGIPWAVLTCKNST